MEHQPKSLFSSAGTPPNPAPNPPPRPKSLFDTMTTPAVSGVYVPSSIVINGTKNDKPTGPKSLLTGAKVRNRIEATVEELRKYGEDDKVIKVSQQQIRETNTDELCLKYVLDWGAKLQENHSTFLDTLIKLSTSPTITAVKSSMGAMVDLMGQVDIMDATKDSWFKSKDKKSQKLLKVLDDLKLLASQLVPDTILELHTMADMLRKGVIELGEQLRPYIVTCSFFSDYDKDDFPKELYITRLASLISTKMGLANDAKTVEALMQTYVNLVDVINTIVRNEFPLWISNLSAVLAGNTADLTQIQSTQSKITNKLKSIL